MKKFLIFLFILFFFSGCATVPGPNLSSKATLVHPNSSTKGEVLAYLGPPVQVFTREDGKEEWYYYYRVKNFWENFPLIREVKGKDYTEILKIVYEGDIVIEVNYYTVENPEKLRR